MTQKQGEGLVKSGHLTKAQAEAMSGAIYVPKPNKRKAWMSLVIFLVMFYALFTFIGVSREIDGQVSGGNIGANGK